MNASLRQDNTGVIVGFVALTVVVVVALLVQYIFVSPLLERERASLSKSLHLEQMLRVSGESYQRTRTELIAHLNILRHGGEFTGLNSTVYSIPASTSDDLIGIVNTVEEVLSRGDGSLLISTTGNLIAAQQLAWSKLTNKVAWFRYAVVFNVLLISIFIFWQLFRRLKRSKGLRDETIDQNRRFLEATNDAVFLITRNYQVGSVQSKAVKNIFGVKQRISGNFFDFLKGMISAGELVDAKKYVSRMLEGRGTNRANPLSKVEISVKGANGATIKKYVSFEFVLDRRNSDASLLVSVSDITKQVRLTNKLAKSNRSLAESVRSNEESMSLLMASIVEDSDQARRFFASAHKRLREITNQLRNGEHDGSTVEKLKSMRRTARKIKLDAGSVGVPLIETSADRFEQKLKKLLAQPDVGDTQVLALTENVRQLVSELNFLEQFNAKLNAKNSAQKLKLASIHEAVPSTATADELRPDSCLLSLQQFANDIASRQNKEVRIEKTGFEGCGMSDAARAEIEALCMQLIHNAVTHCIEPSNKRRELGKPPEALILIQLKQRDEKSVLLRVRDDGLGFDYRAVRKIALERGVVKRDVIKKMNKPELIRFLFRTGLSSNELAVNSNLKNSGLESVKSSVAKLGGKSSVKSSKGVASQVTIQLPSTVLSLTERKTPELDYSDSGKLSTG